MPEKKVEDEEMTSPQDLASDPVIGQLKKMYDNVADEPLPEDLLNLLDKLDQAEKRR